MHKLLTETLNRKKEKKIHNEITISEKQILVKKNAILHFVLNKEMGQS